ncbi:MAG: hypothetical protein CBC29_04850 [Methylococcaceae bacterium TMED69]|nr:MAG: hypothetical protein CBC29_04850 [Methylococcaceae bacterium TMED69]
MLNRPVAKTPSTFLTSKLIGLLLAICAVITTWGFLQTTPLLISSVGWERLHQYVIFLMGGASALLFGGFIVNQISKQFNLNIYAIGVGIASTVVILAGAIWPVFVTIWIAIASYLLGISFLRLLRTNVTKVTGTSAFLVGACLYGTVVGLAAHYPINYPGVYGVALTVPVLLGWRLILSAIQSLHKHLNASAETKYLDLAIVLIGLVHFTVSLMPEVGHDALAMHLFIPGHLVLRHEWGFNAETYVWAVMPALGDWLFSLGYMLAGEQAARLINVGFIFILSWLIRDLALWAGAGEKAARWSVLLFLSTPLTFTESSSLFIEGIWAAFIVGGSLSVFKIGQSNGERAINILLAGIFLGGALAAKAVTFTILPALFIVLVWHCRLWVKSELTGAILLGLALLMTIGSIPYMTAWYLTGNPVFPFFNHIFQSSLYPAVAFDQSGIFAKGLTWDVLYQVTFHSQKFLESRMGAAGFQWILLFVPALLTLLAIRQRRGFILFSVAMLSVALTFQSTAYLRYIFPAFAWVAAGVGVALSVWDTDSVRLKRFVYFIMWSVILLNIVFFKSGTSFGQLSVQPLASKLGREVYLNSRVPIRNAVELVNKLNPSGSPVVVFSSPLAAGLNSDALYPNWYNHRFQRRVSETKTSEDIAQLMMEYGSDYVILDDYWATIEKRELIENATQKIIKINNIAVRKLNSSYRFQTELLKNSDFSSLDGWKLSAGAKLNEASGQIEVSVSVPASQTVVVQPGRHYQNSVTAKCGSQPSQGRVQVNWLDSKSRFISTDIYVFECTPSETTQIIETVAPRNATFGTVYATGHTDTPILITEVSLKQ